MNKTELVNLIKNYNSQKGLSKKISFNKINKNFDELYKIYIENCIKNEELTNKIIKQKLCSLACNYSIETDTKFFVNKKDLTNANQTTYCFDETTYNNFLEKVNNWQNEKKQLTNQIENCKKLHNPIIKNRDIKKLNEQLILGENDYDYFNEITKKLEYQKVYGKSLKEVSKLMAKEINESLQKIAKDVVEKHINNFPLTVCCRHTYEIPYKIFVNQKVFYSTQPLNVELNKLRDNCLIAIKNEKKLNNEKTK